MESTIEVNDVTSFSITTNIKDPKEILLQQAWKILLIGILLGCFICGIILTAILVPVLLTILRTTTTMTTDTTSTSKTTDITTTSITVTTTTTTRTTRTAATTTVGTTVCSTTVITTTVTSSSLPAQCSKYKLITDATRNTGYSVANHTCDTNSSISAGYWVRFSGGAGTMLARCPVPVDQCGTHAPGWYSGVYPSTAGSMTAGTVCYNWNNNTCIWFNSISVINCNGYYVFKLSTPPTCLLRYCTI